MQVDTGSCVIASLCRQLASLKDPDHPSSYTLLLSNATTSYWSRFFLSLISIPMTMVRVSTLILIHQLCWGFGYVVLVGCYAFYPTNRNQQNKQQQQQQATVVRGMPVLAMVLNLGWEFIFGMIWTDQLGWEAHGHRGFMLLNVLLCYQYSQSEWYSTTNTTTTSTNSMETTLNDNEMENDNQAKASTASQTTLTTNTTSLNLNKVSHNVLLSFSLWILLVSFIVELSDYSGVYSFFLVRFVTCLLTVQQLWQDISNPTTTSSTITMNPTLWWFQNILPGICRFMSTTCSSLAFMKIVNHSILLTTVYLLCFLWDMIYISLAITHYYTTIKGNTTTNNQMKMVKSE